ncbi:MAG: hypothetical protein RPU34_02215 [Candidatus Sedimenticola sp. (ex Thyasira tokunagai)]
MSRYYDQPVDGLWPHGKRFPVQLSFKRNRPRVWQNLACEDLPQLVGGLLAPGPESPQALITQLTIEKLSHRLILSLVTLGFTDEIRSADARDNHLLVPMLTALAEESSRQRLQCTATFHPYGLFWLRGESI